MREPASFAFLAGHSIVEEYRKQRGPSFSVRNLIVEILKDAEKRLVKAGPEGDGALEVLRSMLVSYFREWGGVKCR